MPRRTFEAGDKVFAKVRGYPPWPARVVGRVDESTNPSKIRYHIFFYGTGETAILKSEDLFLFIEHRNGKIGKPRKHKGFTDAMMQIENELTPDEKEQMKFFDGNETLDTSGSEDYSSPARRSTNKASKTPTVTASSQNVDSVENIASNSDKTDDKAQKGNRKRKNDVDIEGSDSKKLKHLETVEDQISPKPNSDVTSRSGRKIKQKKFSDFEGSEDEKLAKISPKAERPKSQVKKAEVKDSAGDYLAFDYKGEEIKVNLKSHRPHFNNPKSPLDWDELVMKQALELKQDVLSGEVSPERVNKVMDDWLKKKAVEMKKLYDAEDLKFSVLKTEGKLLQLDLEIKSSLKLRHAEPEICLKHMDDLLSLDILPVMLKKHPEVIETIKRMRRYVGNVSCWSFSEEQLADFEKKAEEIRTKADHIFNKFKSVFLVPQGKPFWQFYSKELEAFHKKTQHLSQDEFYGITNEAALP